MSLKWKIGYSESICSEPDNFIDASVPGAPALDYMAAGLLPDFNYSDNYKKYEWMEDYFWHYKTKLEFNDPEKDKELFLIFRGVDYKCTVFIDKKERCTHEGMFRPFMIKLNKEDKNKILDVVIHPIPKNLLEKIPRCQANIAVKPAVSYGWDFHPRLVPFGLWREVNIEERSIYDFKEFEVTYTLSENLTSARIHFLAEMNKIKRNSQIKIKILDNDGTIILEQRYSPNTIFNADVLLDNIKLWWPNGHGNPYLYKYSVELIEKGSLICKREGIIGFRRVRLVQKAFNLQIGAIPVSRTLPPMAIEVNGKVIFAKGGNWIAPGIYECTISDELYKSLLTLAKDANFNILRCWGGAAVNRDIFYDLCDKMGILIWQEFPLACNHYKDDDGYLDILEKESEFIIKNLRVHPCIAIWCGGNELFNLWASMTEQSFPLRLLNKKCYELDRYTPFLYTSPVMGVTHGHYLFRYNGEDVFSHIQKRKCTAYVEFGIPAVANREVLEKIIEPQNFFPLKTADWIAHHAFEAWMADSWLQEPDINYYFKEPKTLDELIEYSQLLQYSGYKAYYEEMRRQHESCSMALCWCYNEPWPTAANNSIICYPDIPKKAYYGIKDSLKPCVLTSRFQRFDYNAGETLSFTVFLLCESSLTYLEDKVCIVIKIGEKEQVYEISFKWDENPSQEIGNISFPIPKNECGIMTIELQSKKQPEINNIYYLLCRKSNE